MFPLRFPLSTDGLDKGLHPVCTVFLHLFGHMTVLNNLDEASDQQYLWYHFYVCEKPEFLGMSNHLLFVGNVQ